MVLEVVKHINLTQRTIKKFNEREQSEKETYEAPTNRDTDGKVENPNKDGKRPGLQRKSTEVSQGQEEVYNIGRGIEKEKERKIELSKFVVR